MNRSNSFQGGYVEEGVVRVECGENATILHGNAPGAGLGGVEFTDNITDNFRLIVPARLAVRERFC